MANKGIFRKDFLPPEQEVTGSNPVGRTTPSHKTPTENQQLSGFRGRIAPARLHTVGRFDFLPEVSEVRFSGNVLAMERKENDETEGGEENTPAVL